MNFLFIYQQLIQRGTQRIKKEGDFLHKHRIIPGFEGGIYTEENISFLTRKEHRIVHKIRYRLWKKQGDLIAANWLSKNLNDEKIQESQKQGAILGGKIAGNFIKNNNIGIFSQSKEELSKNGKKGGNVAFKNNIGVHAQSKEELSNNQKQAVEIIKNKIKNDPKIKEKYIKLGIKNNKYITQEKRSYGGKISGKKNIESGHIFNISSLGGSAHKGRKYIKHIETGKLKRPKLQELEFYLKTGDWTLLKESTG